MLKDLSDRALEPILFDALLDFAQESLAVAIEKPNIIRVMHSVLKGIPRDSQYFKTKIIPGLVMRYMDALLGKVQGEIEEMSKENIDGISAKVLAVLRLCYKLNKFNVSVQDVEFKGNQLQTLFNKVNQKEEMAKKVLSSDVLAKFKLIKENLLKSIVLLYNLETPAPPTAIFTQFLISCLTSTTLDLH